MEASFDRPAALRPLLAAAALGIAALAGAFAAPSAEAAELIMLERPGCVWCLRWNREIAPVYPKTAESQIAPLRRVDVTRPWPDDLGDIARDHYTPTFIVVEDGREVARLRGYPGEDFFWPMLGEMLDKLPQAGRREPAAAPAASGADSS